jgi:hypothetical protein
MNKLKMYSDLFGSSYALQLTIERNALANMRRQAPLRSNNFGLNVHLGTYDKMEYRDYIGKNKPFDVDENLFRTVEKQFE